MVSIRTFIVMVLVTWLLFYCFDVSAIESTFYSPPGSPSFNDRQPTKVAKHPAIVSAALRNKPRASEVTHTFSDRKDKDHVANATHYLQDASKKVASPGTIDTNGKLALCDAFCSLFAGPERRTKRAIVRGTNFYSTNSGSRKYLVIQPNKERKARKGYYIVEDVSLFMRWAVRRMMRVRKLVLGYDDQGRVYDVYKQMPVYLDLDSVFKTIQAHIIKRMMSGEELPFDAPESFQPPGIVYLPTTSGEEPILISWVRFKRHQAEIASRPVFEASSSTLLEQQVV